MTWLNLILLTIFYVLHFSPILMQLSLFFGMDPICPCMTLSCVLSRELVGRFEPNCMDITLRHDDVVTVLILKITAELKRSKGYVH